MTETTTPNYFTGEQWHDAWREADGNDWFSYEDDDEMVRALLAAYNSEQAKDEKGNPDPDRVLAAVTQLADSVNQFSAADVADAMTRLTADYKHIDDLAEEVLRDQYNSFPLNYIGEASAFWQNLVKDSEEMVEIGDHVYIFRRAGWPR